VATELGSAYISVGLGTNSLAGDIKKAFGGAEVSGSSAGKSAGRGFGGAFGIAAAAVGALGIGTFLKGAVEQASGLGESVNAINVVFGKAASGVQKLGKESAHSLGLSNLEFNNLAVRFSSFASTIAGPGGDVTDTLKSMTGRASDFASVMNLEVSDAAELFQSGLAGETEPLRAFGIDMSAAAVEAYALKNGIATSAASMTEAQKVQARYGVLMASTSKTQGDFANTSNSLANQQRILSSDWKNAQGVLGAALLPAISAVTGALIKGLGPAVSGAQVVITELTGGFRAMGAAFKDGGDDVTSSGFAGVMERIGLVARKAFDGIGPVVGSIGAFIAPLLPMFSALVPQFFALFQALSPTSLLFQALMPVLPQIAAAIGSVIAAVLPLAVSLSSQLLPILTQLITAILPPLISIFTNVVTAIAPLITMIAGLLIPIIQALMPVVVTVFGAIAGIITAAMQVIQGIIQVVTGIITGNWSQVWNGLGNIVSGALATVGAVLVGLKDIVLSALGGIGGWLVDSGRALIQGFIDGIGGMVGAIGDAVGGVLGAVADFFPHSPAKKGPFSGRGYTTYSGAALAGDFATSIEGQRSRVAAAAASVTGAAVLSGSMVPAGATVGGGSATAPAGSAGVNVNIHPAPGMSEETIGRVAAHSLNYQLRMA